MIIILEHHNMYPSNIDVYLNIFLCRTEYHYRFDLNLGVDINANFYPKKSRRSNKPSLQRFRPRVRVLTTIKYDSKA